MKDNFIEDRKNNILSFYCKKCRGKFQVLIEDLVLNKEGNFLRKYRKISYCPFCGTLKEVDNE